MVNIRGVNVYPAAIESVLRHFEEVVEFRSTVSRSGALRSLALEVELTPSAADPRDDHDEDHAAAARSAGADRADPDRRAPAALPRFEMKARRFIIG